MGRPPSCNPCCNGTPVSIRKLDPSGSVLWSRPHKVGYRPDPGAALYSVGVDSLGQIAATGRYSSYNGINTRSFGSDGERLWSVGIGTTTVNYVHAGLNGKLYAVGDPAYSPAYNKVKEIDPTTGATTATITTAWSAIKCVTDAAGLMTVSTLHTSGLQTLEQWDMATGTQTWSMSYPQAIIDMQVDAAGAIYLRTTLSSGDLSSFYKKLDSSGAPAWSRRIDHTGAASPTGDPGPMSLDPAGNLCVSYSPTSWCLSVLTLDPVTGATTSTVGSVPLPADPSSPSPPTFSNPAYVSILSKMRIDSGGNLVFLGQEQYVPFVGGFLYRDNEILKFDPALSLLWRYRHKVGSQTTHDFTIDMSSDEIILVGDPA